MKKLLLAIISVVYSLTGVGQVTYKNNFVALNLPEKTYKLTEHQISSLPGSKSQISSIKLTPPYVYKVDEIIFGFHDVKQDAIGNDIQNTKRFMDELYGAKSRKNEYTSVIKQVSNNQVLIITYILNGIKFYKFYCTNSNKTLTLPGSLQFNKPDSLEGDNVLNEIIKSIKFDK